MTPIDYLTKREQEVLEWLARGLTNRAIGGELCLAENTVEHHLKHIYQKLGVKTRGEAGMLYWNAKNNGNP
jgi:DNA-binding NarL/FixJ family response regulator